MSGALMDWLKLGAIVAYLVGTAIYRPVVVLTALPVALIIIGICYLWSKRTP